MGAYVRTRVLTRQFADDQLPARAAHTRKEAKAAVMAVCLGQGQASDTRGQAPGSKWCAVNAIAEHADYGRRYTKRSNQVQRRFRGHTAQAARARDGRGRLGGSGSKGMRASKGRARPLAAAQRQRGSVRGHGFARFVGSRDLSSASWPPTSVLLTVPQAETSSTWPARRRRARHMPAPRRCGARPVRAPWRRAPRGCGERGRRSGMTVSRWR